MNVIRDLRHIMIMAGLIAIAGVSVQMIRSAMVPKSFGEQGPYRADALATIAAQEIRFPTDAKCHACHDDVREERAESLHATVACVHCHGFGKDHIAEAELAASSNEDASVTPAKPWDGQFPSTIDLFITQDQKTCLVCHESVVGMPAEFKKIDVAEHLEEQGADDPESRETCFECHGGHDTAP
ncbi:MAG: hypothetical protein GY768_05440 [Planctomycetaceae bacterium]|nr:hypothetical protein [Planctomycetaceae bacterium]